MYSLAKKSDNKQRTWEKIMRKMKMKIEMVHIGNAKKKYRVPVSDYSLISSYHLEDH